MFQIGTRNIVPERLCCQLGAKALSRRANDQDVPFYFSTGSGVGCRVAGEAGFGIYCGNPTVADDADGFICGRGGHGRVAEVACRNTWSQVFHRGRSRGLGNDATDIDAGGHRDLRLPDQVDG